MQCKVHCHALREVRTRVRSVTAQPENERIFSLPFRPPLDWKGMLAFLAPRATPGVELVEQNCYRRTIHLNAHSGYFEASTDRGGKALNVRVHGDDPRWLPTTIQRVRSMFDLDADWREIAARLRKDKLLAPLLSASPGLRPPGCWDGFELAIRAILGQQVTVKGATTLAGRLARDFGTPLDGFGGVAGNGDGTASGLAYIFPKAEALIKADIASIGLPRARAESIRALAQAVAENKIKFDGVTDADQFRAQLCDLPGIGAWTAHYISMRALRDPDAFPASDLGLLRAAGLKSPQQLEERSQKWRPWRAYAAMYLWRSLSG